VYVYKQGSAADILPPTQWNLIGRSLTALSPVLSPSSFIIPAGKNSARVSKTVI
jgi:hypothetical protein